MKFFLGDRAETHDGPEQISDLVNGQPGFLPAVDDLGRFLLVNRHAIVVVSIDAPDEQPPGGVETAPDLLDTTHVGVSILLENGASIKGTVSYLLPDSQRRLQDFLNRGPRFLEIRQGRTIHLVNKHRIAGIWSD